MGVSLNIFISPIVDGVMYHEMNADKQKEYDEKYGGDIDEIVEIERNDEMIKFFQHHGTRVESLSDSGRGIYYIDKVKTNIIIYELKKKIDALLESPDRYSSKFYGDGTMLHEWALAHDGFEQFKQRFDLEYWYLVVDIGY